MQVKRDAIGVRGPYVSRRDGRYRGLTPRKAPTA